MIEVDEFTLPGFKYLTGESENMCRLCFSATKTAVFLDDSQALECYYYDDIVTFEDMLSDLGMPREPSLPQVLCENCAESTTKAYLFDKMCKYSYNKWQETVEKLNKSLDLFETLGPGVKTAYLLVKNDSIVLTSRKVLKEKKIKEAALVNIQSLLKARQRHKKGGQKHSTMCSECGQTFHSISYLWKHMEKHANKKYPCPECHKLFQSLENFHRHWSRIHKPKTVQCTKCAKMFSTEKMLMYHEASYHVTATCQKCSMQFPSKCKLRRHMSKHDIHKCSCCSREFSNKVVLKAHVKICGRNQNINFFCDICDKGYVRKNSLRSHLITTHGFGHTYTCNWCSKQFDAVSKLNMHVVKHTRERNFHCEECGGKFVTKAALTYHTRIHTGERPYPCDICNENFLSSSRRMEHKRRKHFGPKQNCTICSSKFTTKFELRKHMARHSNPQSRLFIENNKGKKISSAVKNAGVFSNY